MLLGLEHTESPNRSDSLSPTPSIQLPSSSDESFDIHSTGTMPRKNSLGQRETTALEEAPPPVVQDKKVGEWETISLQFVSAFSEMLMCVLLQNFLFSFLLLFSVFFFFEYLL